MALRLGWAAIFFLLPSAQAAEFIVQSERSAVHSGPSTDSPTLGHLPRGKRVYSLEEEGKFVRVRSRTGRDLWVQKAALAEVPPMDTRTYDVIEDVQSELPIAEPAFKRLRLDLGASGGSVSSQSFVEVAAGLEYFMMERLSWRNAVFYRIAKVQGDLVGFDSSIRGNGNLPLGALKLRGIIGVGFRFAPQDNSAPFGEVGGFASLGGFDVGFMLKYLHPIHDSNAPGVAIYSVLFSGATGFF